MTNRIRAAIVTTCLALLLGGCAGAPEPTDVPAREQGARVWRATCSGCHTLRPPSQYSSVEWPVIVNHMRTRADLTRSEARAVTAYLSGLAR